jgi:hypothetical protein
MPVIVRPWHSDGNSACVREGVFITFEDQDVWWWEGKQGRRRSCDFRRLKEQGPKPLHDET